jgi:hypothetical protein
MGDVRLGDDHGHADAAVEGARHFLGLYLSLRLQEGHQARLGPGVGVDMGVELGREDAGDILEQAAAGDVGEGVDMARADQRQQRANVDAGGGHQRVDEEGRLVEDGRAVQFPALVGGEAADEAVAVAVDARRGEAEDHVSGDNLVSGQHLIALDRADAEAGEVIVAIAIHARHFGGLAADQRAAGLAAALGDAGDHGGGDSIVEFAGGIIVEKEERLRALHDKIVDAHGDEIDADRVMFAAVDGEFELGTDTVIGGDEQRIGEACSAQVEKAAETAEIGVGTGAAGGLGERRDGADQRIACGYRDAGLGVCVSGGGLVGVCHPEPLANSGFDFHGDMVKRARVTLLQAPLRRFPLWLILCAGIGAMGAAAVVVAQIEPGDRGITPINSSSDLMVSGVRVDTRGDSAEEARMNGWQEAQRKGWEALFKQVNGGASAPGLPDSTLNGIVSAIVVEREQIGPGRYIATLGVQFDRARAGQILGISGRIFRSPPYLVLPIVYEGGIPQAYERRSDWQRAWAEFRTADSSVDYVRTAGTGADPLLLNAGQMRRRGRRWWREILDQYGASDVLTPTVRIERTWPGGPVVGYFSARYGPDNELLGSFRLSARTPAEVRRMMVEGVRRVDAIYTGALADGRLRTDPSLIIEEPVAAEEIEQVVEATTDPTAGAVTPGETPAASTAAVETYSVQVDTPDAGAVLAVEQSLRALGGVEGANTSSVAIGGVSVVRVRYRGDAAALRATLAAAGWRVAESGGTFRITR